MKQTQAFGDQKQAAVPIPNEVVAALHAEADAREFQFDAVGVEHSACAEYLRNNVDLEAFALDEADWRERVPHGGDLLLIGARMQRLAGDMMKLGVGQCFGADVPPQYRWPSEYLEERAKVANYQFGKADAAELWRVVTDQALPIDVEPTGHPGLQPKPATIEVFSLQDLAAQPRRKHVVPGIILEDSLNVLVGPPKQFKTVIGDGLCVALADGSKFFGRQVTRSGLVVDAALEGVGGKVDRYRAHIGLDRFVDPNDPIHRRLFLMRTIPDLTTVAGQDLFLRTIDQLTQRTGEELIFLKVDTLGRALSIAGLDENKTGDMGAFVAGLDRIRSNFPSAQMVIHHTGKNGIERGSTALAGAADLLMFSKKTGKFEAKVDVRDARDVEVPDPWIVTFAPVTVGEHEDGRPVTALRIDTVRQEAATGTNAEGRPGSTNEQIVERVLDVAGNEGLTRAQLAGESGLGLTTALEVVRRLIGKGIAFKLREGKRWRYFHTNCRATVEQLSGAVGPTVPPTATFATATVGLSAPSERGAASDSCPSTVAGDAKCGKSPNADGDLSGTPPDLIAASRQPLGAIDLDPATHGEAQARVQATSCHNKVNADPPRAEQKTPALGNQAGLAVAGLVDQTMTVTLLCPQEELVAVSPETDALHQGQTQQVVATSSPAKPTANRRIPFQVRHDPRLEQNHYCGPAALSVMSGRTAELCAAVIEAKRIESASSSQKKVRRSFPAEIIDAGKTLGLTIKSPPTLKGMRRLRDVLQASETFPDAMYLVSVPGHCVVVLNGRIYDSLHNQGIDARDHKHQKANKVFIATYDAAFDMVTDAELWPATAPIRLTKWIGTCPACGKTTRAVATKRLSCVKCATRFDERFLLQWERIAATKTEGTA